MRQGDLNYGRLLRLTATRYPESPFVTCADQTFTYREFDQLVNRVAHRLLAAGLRAGDRVAMWSYNSDRLLALMFASAKIGCAVMPISTMVTDEDVKRSIDVSAARVFAFGTDFKTNIEQLRADLDIDLWIDLDGVADPEYALDFAVLAADGDYSDPLVTVDDGLVASILFTSGSTGTPKGALKSFSNLAWGGINRQLAEPRTRASVELFAIPLAGIGFSNFVVADVLAGAHLVLMRKFEPAQVLELVARHRVSHVFLAPTMISALLRLAPPPRALASVTALETAYEMSIGQRQATSRAFINAKIMYGYGMTEGSMSRTPPERFLDGGACVGYPSGIDEYRIVLENGQPAPVGEIGEIEIGGPTTMMGYLGLADDDTMTADGWVRSGDLGRFAPDGTLEFVGRRKDMIKSGGYNVFAAEVERVLDEFPGVERAVVIGLPHDYWGEAVVAVLTVESGTTPDLVDLKQFLGTRLAGFMLPKEYVVVDEIPLNPGGKVAKGVLTDKYAEMFSHVSL